MENTITLRFNVGRTLTFLAVLMAAAASYAVKPAPLCSRSIATTTSYFVPHIKDYCPGQTTPCAKFRSEVKMQGTGTLGGGRVLRYTGKVENLGDCQTAKGAAGKCLIPYVSVAADPRYYRMGDIIKMPNMKGRQVTMPDGRVIEHPGYFIVHDTGGAIKGPNRFDFFTGSHRPQAAANIFGYKGMKDLQIASAGQCTSLKQFAIVRRGTSEFQVAEASIQDAATGSNKTQLASIDARKGIL